MADKPIVGVVMGSWSDYNAMHAAVPVLEALGIPHELRVVSAHRTPHALFEYATKAEERGLEAIIAGAGGAAHLPGMLAALTWVPVIGVPMESPSLRGLDSLLSIVQMPHGVPVGTMAIGEGGAINAALYAAAMIGVRQPLVRDALRARRAQQARDALDERNGDKSP